MVLHANLVLRRSMRPADTVLTRSRQVHASPARALVEPPVAGPCPRQAPGVRAMGLARGASGSGGSRGRSLGAGEEGFHAVREVRTAKSAVGVDPPAYK